MYITWFNRSKNSAISYSRKSVYDVIFKGNKNLTKDQDKAATAAGMITYMYLVTFYEDDIAPPSVILIYLDTIIQNFQQSFFLLFQQKEDIR